MKTLVTNNTEEGEMASASKETSKPFDASTGNTPTKNKDATNKLDGKTAHGRRKEDLQLDDPNKT